MCTKFAAERTAMHSLIDAATKRDERYQSVIRSLNPSPSSEIAAAVSPEPRRTEGPTLVGDLRRLVDTSRVDNSIDSTPQPTAAAEMPAAEVPAVAEAPLEWAGRLRSRHGPYPWLALALVVGLVGYFWLRPDPPPSASPTPSPQLETRTHAATAAPPAGDPPAPAPEPAVTVPPPSAATTPEPAPARPARVWRPRSAVASDGGNTRLRPATGEKSVREDAAGGPAVEQNTLPRATSKPAQPLIGQDLRELPRRRQRPIDLEDPYR